MQKQHNKTGKPTDVNAQAAVAVESEVAKRGRSMSDELDELISSADKTIEETGYSQNRCCGCC
jgi:hypothetical protein